MCVCLCPLYYAVMPRLVLHYIRWWFQVSSIIDLQWFFFAGRRRLIWQAHSSFPDTLKASPSRHWSHHHTEHMLNHFVDEHNLPKTFDRYSKTNDSPGKQVKTISYLQSTVGLFQLLWGERHPEPKYEPARNKFQSFSFWTQQVKSHVVFVFPARRLFVKIATLPETNISLPLKKTGGLEMIWLPFWGKLGLFSDALAVSFMKGKII